MAARPCPISLTGCPGVDSPITNVSAEAADPLLFAAEAWDLYDPYKPPRLGDGISVRRDCTAIINAFSIYDPIIYAGSQALANLMALAQSLGCTWPSRPGVTYGNDEQTGTVYCSSGAAFSYTVPADTVTFTTDDVELGTAFVQWANAWAAAYAFEQASALLDCPSGDPDNPPPPGDDPPTFPSGPGILNNPSWMCFGEEYHDTYRISGARTVGYTFEVISGSLPPGTTLIQTGPREAVISGTPTAPGQYTWTIKGTSTSLPTTTVQFTDSLWVFGITNWDSLTDAQEGVPYGPEQINSVGGTAPFTFASTNLPTGFSLASDGTLTSDDTTIQGDYTFDVTVTDARGGECTQEVLITVSPPPYIAYQVCNYATAVNAMAGTGGCSFQFSLTVWTGLLDQLISSTLPGNYPIYYFVTGILSVAKQFQVAADQVAGYPAPGWQDAGPYTRLAWNGTRWQLIFACTAQPGPSFMWVGDGPTTLGNAAGVYTRNAGISLSANPSCITVAGVNNLLTPTENCPFCDCAANTNISSLTWAYVPGSPTGLSSMSMAGGDGTADSTDLVGGGYGASAHMHSSSFCVNSPSGYLVTFEADLNGNVGDGVGAVVIFHFRLDGLPFAADFAQGTGAFSTTYSVSTVVPQGTHTIDVSIFSQEGTTLPSNIVATAIRIRPLTPP